MVFSNSNKNNKDKNKLLFFFLKSGGNSLTNSQRDFYVKELEKELRDFYFKMPPVMLSANSLAREIGVSHYKVKKWIELGKLPAKKLRTNHYLINLQEAEPFLKEEGFFDYFQNIKKSFLF